MINTQNSQEGDRDNLHPPSIPGATYVDIDLREEQHQGSTYVEPSVRLSPMTVPPEPIRQPPIYHISVVQVPHNEEELFKIFRYRKSLKFFTMIDAIFLLLNSFLSAPFSLIYLIALCFVAFGYIGAKEYKPCYIIFYMVYLVCRALSEIVFMIVIPETFILVLGMIMFAIDCYICHFAYKFYMLLKTASQETIVMLQNGWNPNRDARIVLY
jgi:hypothetical protein